jgi:putative flippase GtrA
MLKSIRKLVLLIYGRRATIAKYLASGSTAASVQLSLLYILTHYGGLHYLVSSSISFVIAVCVGFVLQKFWTFDDSSMGRIPRQAAMYVGLGVTTLGINAGMMFVFVHVFHLWYLFSQVLACGLVACGNFMVYNFFIFKSDI